VGAGWSAENSVLVLQAHQIDIAKIQEICSLPIRSQVSFAQLESHSRRVTVALFCVVDRQREQLCGTEFSVNCVTQVCRECRDTTLPGKVVPDNGNPARQHWPWMCKVGCGRLIIDYEGTQFYRFAKVWCIGKRYGFYLGDCVGQWHPFPICDYAVNFKLAWKDPAQSVFDLISK
jgi:hypothetical protein